MWDEGIIGLKRNNPGLKWDSYNQGKPQLRIFWFPQLLSTLICTSLNQCKRTTCLQIKEISVLLRCLNNNLRVTDISISPLSRKSLYGTLSAPWCVFSKVCECWNPRQCVTVKKNFGNVHSIGFCNFLYSIHSYFHSFILLFGTEEITITYLPNEKYPKI